MVKKINIKFKVKLPCYCCDENTPYTELKDLIMNVKCDGVEIQSLTIKVCKECALILKEDITYNIDD